MKEQKENMVVELKKKVVTQTEDMNQIENRIRQQGTYTLSLVPLKEDLHQPNNPYYQPEEPYQYHPD